VEQEHNQRESWIQLKEIVESGNVVGLNSFLDTLSAGDTARAISRLDEETQKRLFVLLSPVEAAELIEDLPDAQAADLIDDLPENTAAAIVEELPSDQQADILAQLPREEAEGILQEMDPQDAQDARRLMEYASDTAGGIMVTEFLSFFEDLTVKDILDNLRQHAEVYAGYDVLYAYVVNRTNALMGVVRLRDLLLAPNDVRVGTLMKGSPIKVNAAATLDELREVFERHDFYGVPVVEDHGKLVGVLQRAAFRDAMESKADRNFLAASGILGGEELRSLPTRVRTLRRLSFLILKIGLNLVSASVIGAYSDTLSSVVALALFLPIISDMGGVSGNQALAVSIRELTLGLIKPKDYWLVFWNEARLGVWLGVFIGAILGSVAALWQKNIILGVVVGAALTLNTILSVCVGGMVPLILRRFRIDPALASSGILTFVTDACGFFFILALATQFLKQIAG
jgi:magnesium transporter